MSNANASIDPIKMSDSELTDHIKLLAKKGSDLFSSYARNRSALAEALAVMKSRVSKSGCEGGWSEFLRSVEIPRKSADRLVDAYKIVGTMHANLRSEAIKAEVDLFKPSVVAELEKIRAEFVASPTDNEIPDLVERLEGARMRVVPKPEPVAHSAVVDDCYMPKSTTYAISHKIARMIKALPPDQRSLVLECMVKEIATLLNESYDVVIKPRGTGNPSTTEAA